MHLRSRNREAVLAFAAAAFEARPLPTVRDWDSLLKEAHSHRLVPLASRLLADSACPDDVKQTFRRGALAWAARSLQLERELTAVLSEFEAAGIEALVLKGPALARSIYPQASLRPYADLDLLVHEEDWVATHRAMLALGFVPTEPLMAPPPKVWARKAYYHMQYDRGAVGARVEVHYDLWWYGLRLRDGEAVWRRAVPVVIQGHQAMMVSPEDQIVHLAVHAHHHAYSHLIWLTDLALWLRRDGIDWERVVSTARSEGVSLLVYYSLLYVQRLLGVLAPFAVMNRLRPARIQMWVHDRLWPPDAILGLKVNDRVLADFQEIPEGQELILNFILTGRRWEKLIYLTRLLVPSPEWLRYFYRTGRLSFPQRALYAPKLIARVVRDLGQAARHGLVRRPL